MKSIVTQLPRQALILLVQGYQLCLSPFFHAIGITGCGCRHFPTCSEYAKEALRTHGLLRGLWLSMRRLASCHPWGSHGYDPVPLPKHNDRSLNAHG